MNKDIWVECTISETTVGEKCYINRILNLSKTTQIGKRTINTNDKSTEPVEVLRFTMDHRNTAEWWFNNKEERDKTYDKIVELIELKVV